MQYLSLQKVNNIAVTPAVDGVDNSCNQPQDRCIGKEMESF